MSIKKLVLLGKGLGLSSSNEVIIRSIEDVIAALGELAGNIKNAPDVEGLKKNAAIQNVSAVAGHLDEINQTLFAPPPFEEREIHPQSETSEMLEAAASELADANLSDDDALVDQFVLKHNSLMASIERVTAFDDVSEAITEDQPSEVDDRDVVIETEIIEEDVDQTLEVDAVGAFVSKELQSQLQDDLPVEVQHSDVQPGDIQPLPVQNNLTFIDGINDEVMQTLSEMNVTTFHEIAHFKETDVLRIGNLLNDPGRICRENWIEQAALLELDQPTFYAKNLMNENPFDRGALYQSELFDEAQMKVMPGVRGIASIHVDDRMEDEAGDEIEQGVDAVETDAVDANETSEILSGQLVDNAQSNTTPELEDEVIDDGYGDQGEGPHEGGGEDELNSEEIDQAGDGEIKDPLVNAKAEMGFLPSFAAAAANVRRQTRDNGDVVEEVFPSSDIEEQHEPIVDIEDTVVDPEFAATSLNGIADATGDEAMWHEEVSTSRDYVPPIVDETDKPFDQYEETGEESGDVADGRIEPLDQDTDGEYSEPSIKVDTEFDPDISVGSGAQQLSENEIGENDGLLDDELQESDMPPPAVPQGPPVVSVAPPPFDQRHLAGAQNDGAGQGGFPAFRPIEGVPVAPPPVSQIPVAQPPGPPPGPPPVGGAVAGGPPPLHPQHDPRIMAQPLYQQPPVQPQRMAPPQSPPYQGQYQMGDSRNINPIPAGMRHGQPPGGHMPPMLPNGGPPQGGVPQGGQPGGMRPMPPQPPQQRPPVVPPQQMRLPEGDAHYGANPPPNNVGEGNGELPNGAVDHSEEIETDAVAWQDYWKNTDGEENGRDDKKVSSGFREKAKKFSDSLQQSFKDRT